MVNNILDCLISLECTRFSYLCNDRLVHNGVFGHVLLVLTKKLLVFWMSVSVVAQKLVFIELPRVNALKRPWAHTHDRLIF